MSLEYELSSRINPKYKMILGLSGAKCPRCKGFAPRVLTCHACNKTGINQYQEVAYIPLKGITITKIGPGHWACNSGGEDRDYFRLRTLVSGEGLGLTFSMWRSGHLNSQP